MKKANLHISTFSLLLLLVFITSCNGQVKTDQKNGRENEAKTATNGQTKIRKNPDVKKTANVHCGLQDKQGNMWFCTTGQGVYRYDGNTFTNFTTKDGLSSNTVFSILEDKAGNLWFGTDIGVVCRYDGKTFTPISIPSANGEALVPNSLPAYNKPMKNPVNSIFQDKSGKIWFGTNDGVFNYNGNSFTRFLQNDGVINKSGLNLNATTTILQDSKGNMWFTTWFEGVCRFDGKSITSFKPNNEVWFSSLMEEKNGDIWVGRRTKGITRFDGKTFTNLVQHGILDSCGADAFTVDKAGNIWIAAEFGKMTEREIKGGLWRFDGKSFKNFTTKDGLPDNAVFCLVEDRAGNLWIGTRNMGLCRYDGKTFTSFSE
jgi:ligand-binding sensor domain-containing protein